MPPHPFRPAITDNQTGQFGFPIKGAPTAAPQPASQSAKVHMARWTSACPSCDGRDRHPDAKGSALLDRTILQHPVAALALLLHRYFDAERTSGSRECD